MYFIIPSASSIFYIFSLGMNKKQNQNNNNQPAIVFDLGGVLIDWNPRYLYRKLFDDEAEMEAFLAKVCTSEWNNWQDAGRSWADAVGELAGRYPEQRALIEAYHRRWPEMIGGAFDDTVEVLAALRERGYFLSALTNWSAETFPWAQQRFEFLGWFEQIVVSGREKCMKPDPRIFHILLDRIGRQAADCIFIDDNLPNIQAAQKLGFTTIHFRTSAGLHSALGDLGIILNP
jgi:2-haloacid dehalogenase